MTSSPAAPSRPAPRLRPVHRQMRFATPRVVAALMIREMGATYGRRPGGYLWSVLEPVAGIVLLSALFTAIGFRSPALGTNFAIFYATGLLPYFMATQLAGQLAGALRASRALLAYPRVTVLDVLAARFLLNLLTKVMVSYIVLAGILIWFETGTQLLFGPVVLGFTMAAALGAGLGLLNCFLFTRFPAWQGVWNVATRPLMLVSGVIFLIENLPAEWRSLFLWNPLIHVTAQVRKGFYHGYDAPYVSPAFVFGIALGMAIVGFLFLWRTHRDLLED